MAKQTSLFLTKQIDNAGQDFNFNESGIYKTIFTAGNDDSIIKSINVTHTVTGSIAPATLPMPFELAISGSNANEPSNIYRITTINLPAMAGSGAIQPIDAISASGCPGLPIDNAGKRYYPIKSGVQIVGRFLNNLTANGIITVTVIAENY